MFLALVGVWATLLNPPAEYAGFEREVVRVARYDAADFEIELYTQANGPNTRQRVMIAVPHGLKGKAPCVIAPFYFPEAMLGFDPANGTNLAAYAGITYMTDLARRGYITISADAYYRTYATQDAPAGDAAKWRHAGEALGRDWPAWSGCGKLVFDTRLLVDLAVADPRVDADRIGMIGHSLGGKMAYLTGLTDPRVKVVVASDFGLGWTQTNWNDVWYWGAKLETLRAQGLSNVDLLSQSGGKPFCLIAGCYDDADSGLLMRSAAGYVTHPENLLFIHHGKGHRPPRDATEKGYDFLDRYLAPNAKPVDAASASQARVTAEALPPAERELAAKIPEIFAKSAAHYRALDAAATPQMKVKAEGDAEETVYRLPHSWDPKTGELKMYQYKWWTAGHYPGSLWYLYEATGDAFFRDRATEWTKLLAPNSEVTDNHDIGFIMYCSYGNARRLLKTDRYDALLLKTAESLSKRFSEKLGLIRSWGDIKETENFKVIPDNMMNLELLMWAGKEVEKRGGCGERNFCQIAKSHADVSMKNHFRPDGSCYHVLDYDQKTGRVRAIYSGQGASCVTAWSRGQSWGIYGFTMMYRETREKRYLDFAQKLADYAINAPTMPADGVPYWDYGCPGEERDSSAASVMASGLLELADYAPAEKAAVYRAFAVKQLLTLTSPAYFAAPGENGDFLLKHATDNKPLNRKVDAPLDYGDYYFLEALLRFRKSL